MEITEDKFYKFNDLLREYTPKLQEYGPPFNSSWVFAHGLCFYYAYVFSHVFGGKIWSYQTKDLTGHCFVKLNNKYFDAENFNIDNWKKLQSFLEKSSDKKLKRHNKPQSALKRWGGFFN